jgi:hypothetical protein
LVGLVQASPHLVQLDVVPSWVAQPVVSVVVHLAQPTSQLGLHEPAPQAVPPEA